MTTFQRPCIMIVALLSCFNVDVSSSDYSGSSQGHSKTTSSPHSASEDKGSSTDESSVELNQDNTEKRPFGRLLSGSYKIGKRRLLLEHRYNPSEQSNPLYNGEIEDEIDLIDPLFAFSENNGIEPESSGYKWQPGKRHDDHSMNDFVLDEEPLSDDFTTMAKKFVMRTAYPRLLFMDSKRPLGLGSSLKNKRLEVSKRPFVFGYGKRSDITDDGDFQKAGKRPFVLGGGWKIGKRPFVLSSTFGKRSLKDYMQVRPFVLRGNYRLGNGAFTLGNWGMYDRRYTKTSNEELTPTIIKRPFVLGSGWRIGKRPSTDAEKFRIHVDKDIDKRPFVLGGGYKFGKRHFLFEKSVPEDNLLDKRPFILGTGWRPGKRANDLEYSALTSEWPKKDELIYNPYRHDVIYKE